MTLRRSFLLVLLLLTLLGGAAIGIALTKNLLIVNWDGIAPNHLFSADRPLPIPSLQTISAGAVTDAAALRRIAAWFDDHQAELAVIFQESDPARLRGLFAMYESHVSHRYGAVDYTTASFLTWLGQPISECSRYARFSGQLMGALGLTWRTVGISGATHEFTEALIDGHWEYFDATINVWANRSAFEMERGANRQIRQFYTPLLDPDYAVLIAPDVLRSGQELRLMMPLLGVGFSPKAYLFVDQQG